MVVCWTKIGPESVPVPVEADKKIAPSPLRPLANRMLMGFAMVTS